MERALLISRNGDSGEEEEPSLTHGFLSQHLSWVSSQPVSAQSRELPAKATPLLIEASPDWRLHWLSSVSESCDVP